MNEFDMMRERNLQVHRIRRTLTTTRLFDPWQLYEMLLIDSVDITKRHKISVKSGLFTVTRFPLIEGVGLHPFWQIQQKEGSGILIGRAIFYDNPGLDTGDKTRFLAYYQGDSINTELCDKATVQMSKDLTSRFVALA